MANRIVDVFNKIGQFLNEVKLELGKVSWCTRAELKDSTVIVLVSILILAVIVGIFDFFMSKLISMVIK